MKVHDVMKQAAVCCRSDANVGAAVELLWVNNCGMLPVVGNSGKLEGVVTDYPQRAIGGRVSRPWYGALREFRPRVYK